MLLLNKNSLQNRCIQSMEAEKFVPHNFPSEEMTSWALGHLNYVKCWTHLNKPKLRTIANVDRVLYTARFSSTLYKRIKQFQFSVKSCKLYDEKIKTSALHFSKYKKNYGRNILFRVTSH